MSKKRLNGTSSLRARATCASIAARGWGSIRPTQRRRSTLGAALARNDIGLVYGGGSLGLMGEVARATLDHGGRVTGIIPGFLVEKEAMMRDVHEMIVTEDMHERKRLMFERSDAFVALPGGVGTLEELVEQLTWVQLGRHTKPVIVANIDGFWTPFLALLTHMKTDTFIRPGLDVSFTVVDDAAKIVPAIAGAWDKRPARRPTKPCWPSSSVQPNSS